MLYPILIIAISIYIAFMRDSSVEGYFFGEKGIHWSVIGISLLTTTFFSPYIISFLPNKSVTDFPLFYGGVSFIVLFVLGFFLIPHFSKMNVNTLPEYFEKRYSHACKYLVSSIYIIANVIIRLLVILIAGNSLISIMTGADASYLLLFLLFVSSIYLIIGGLQAEIYISIIQVALIAIAVIIFTIWFFIRSNNPELNANFENIPVNSGNKISPFSLLFGLPLIGFGFWCTDQLVFQKVKILKNDSASRKMSLLTGGLQIIPVIIFLFPLVLATAANQTAGRNDLFISIFKDGTIPKYLIEIIVIGVISALMASFASVLSSTSTLITYDFYRYLNPTASGRKLVLVGRLTIIALLFCSIMLVPAAQSMSFEFCFKLFFILSYFISLVVAVFIVGLLTERIKAISAFITLVTGSFLIVLRSIQELMVANVFSNPLLKWFFNSDFIEFSIFIFATAILSLFAFNSQRVVKIFELLTRSSGGVELR